MIVFLNNVLILVTTGENVRGNSCPGCITYRVTFLGGDYTGRCKCYINPETHATLYSLPVSSLCDVRVTEESTGVHATRS